MAGGPIFCPNLRGFEEVFKQGFLKFLRPPCASDNQLFDQSQLII